MLLICSLLAIRYAAPMRRIRRFCSWTILAVLLLPGLSFAPGCATLQQLAALRNVDFRIAGLGDLSVAGVELARVRSVSDLGMVDLTRVTSAYMDGTLPLELRLDVEATNPESNSVTAKLLALDWTLLLEGKETISGGLPQSYDLAPGAPTMIPLRAQLDLLQFFSEGLDDIVNVAAGLSGAGGRSTEVQLRASPTVETPIGPMTWPEPITIVRTDVGG